MSQTSRNTACKMMALSAALVLTPVIAASAQQQTQPQTQQQAPVQQKHHSILKGAAVGAVGGHLTHHKHGALVGAAIGAEVQHHRNKKAKKSGY
ncbi:MAG: hypothetical protein ABI322_09425 [Gemmatimonadaceae bacterium]